MTTLVRLSERERDRAAARPTERWKGCHRARHRIKPMKTVGTGVPDGPLLTKPTFGISKEKEQGIIPAPKLCVVADVVHIAGEKKINTPQSRNSHKCVDDARQHASRAARKPGYKIKGKQTDKTPVYATDDCEHEGDFVDDHHFVLPSFFAFAGHISHRKRPYFV